MASLPPLVSVIVPTYNCAAFLQSCLDSVLAQDYPHLEVLVMDGGSKDETLAIAQSYGKRIRVVSEPDKGIYDAMNKGIATSSGEWLFFLGADDTFAGREVVSTMMASEGARDESILMLYGDVNSARLGERYRGETGLAEILRENICHQAVFYRRRMFEIEGPYDLRYRLYADWDTNLKVYLHHPRAHRYVDCLVANYAEGASSDMVDEVFMEHFESNVWRYADECRGSLGRDVRAILYAREIERYRATLRGRRAIASLTAAAIWKSSILRQVAQGKIRDPWHEQAP